jgi:hypothetical protein
MAVIRVVMKVVQTSETLINLYQSTWRYNPEDSHLHTNCCENLKTWMCLVLVGGTVTREEWKE